LNIDFNADKVLARLKKNRFKKSKTCLLHAIPERYPWADPRGVPHGIPLVFRLNAL